LVEGLKLIPPKSTKRKKSMSKLLEKLLKVGSTTGASLLSESDLFATKPLAVTSLPILNLAFHGRLDGGVPPGLTILAGESKTFKSALSLYCMKAYLDEYKDGVGILYDSEFGISPDYIRSFGIDPSRVIHIPVEHVEQLKFDFNKKLEEIKRGDHVFFLVDSIGQLSSKKEFEDAHDEKSVTDMTRAKSIRSLMRLITIQLSKKDLPCFMVNHVYATMELYSKIVIPGGTSLTYSSNQIFVISKSQEKDSDGTLDGWKFTINIHKSRSVREKAKFPFTVMYEGGIQKYSGLLDIMLELGIVQKPSNGWFSRVDMSTGVVEEKKWRRADTDVAEFWNTILDNKIVQEKLKSAYALSGSILGDEEIDATMDSLED
jgi:RecA/RadA recombinase